MQLRCSTGLSGNYITSLHVIFFKIYDKNIIYTLFKKTLSEASLHYIKIETILLLQVIIAIYIILYKNMVNIHSEVFIKIIRNQSPLLHSNIIYKPRTEC